MRRSAGWANAPRSTVPVAPDLAVVEVGLGGVLCDDRHAVPCAARERGGRTAPRNGGIRRCASRGCRGPRSGRCNGSGPRTRARLVLALVAVGRQVAADHDDVRRERVDLLDRALQHVGPEVWRAAVQVGQVSDPHASGLRARCHPRRQSPPPLRRASPAAGGRRAAGRRRTSSSPRAPRARSDSRARLRRHGRAGVARRGDAVRDRGQRARQRAARAAPVSAPTKSLRDTASRIGRPSSPARGGGAAARSSARGPCRGPGPGRPSTARRRRPAERASSSRSPGSA